MEGAGDSGQGMTGGAIAGILLPSLICGEYHPWARLYSPSRAPAVAKETLTGVAGVTLNTAQVRRGVLGWSPPTCLFKKCTALDAAHR